MADIRIRDLPTASPPVDTDFVPIDNGTTRKTDIQSLVETGRPTASQAEAEAGVDAVKSMSPLTTKQAVDFYGLTKAGNLAGLTNTVTARSNLGLGSAAVENASAFATAAQGVLADGAAQKSANLSDLTNLLTAKQSLGDFQTEAAFSAATIAAAVLYVVTAGYSVIGDGGGHMKKRISTPGAPQAWQKQSADGAWWEIASSKITPQMLGAVGDGVANDTTALTNAGDAAVALGRKLWLLSGSTYLFTQWVIPNNCEVEAEGSVLRSDGTLTVAADITLAIGDNFVCDSLKVTTPGTETNTDIISLGDNPIIGNLIVEADAQRAGGGITTDAVGVNIGYLRTNKIDRPIHLFNQGLVSQTVGNYIGFLEVVSYVRAFRADFCEFTVGGIRATVRSANASKSPGHNAALIIGCADWSIGDIWAEDTGEHVVRIGGSTALPQVTKNYSIGVITAIRCGGCAFKVNPTLKTTITGTVAVSSGSPTLTGTGTTFTTALQVGDNIRITDTSEIYRIISITNNTVATLDRNVTTTDASSALEVMEAARNGAVKGVLGIDVGDPADAGNEELLRITHARQLNIGWALAYTDGDLVSAQYLAQVNDIDGVTIGTLGGENLNSGFINFDGTSDIDVGQFGGDVTNFSVQRIIGAMNGGNNAVLVNTTFNLSKVSLNFDGISGWVVNFIRWDAGTLTGLFEVTGRVGGVVTPVYLTVPDSDNFLIDIAYNNSRTQGRPTGLRAGTAVYEVMSGVFALANAPPTSLFVNATRATAGAGAYGGSVELSRPGSARRAGAVTAKQITATAFQTGIALMVGNPGAVGNDALIEGAVLDHDGKLSVIGEYQVDATKVVGNRVTGWTAATGTATRTTFATGTVTTAQLAERVKALIDDLITHGLIGT